MFLVINHITIWVCIYCGFSVASCVWLFETPWTIAHLASLSITISRSLLKLTSTESVIPSTIFTLLPASPLALSLSQHQALGVRWPKFWSFSISLSNEYSGFISFRIDSFDLLTVQGTLKSPLAPQFESISSLALSLLYGPTLTSVHNYQKNHSFDYTDLCCKVMSLLFNMLSRFVIAFFQGASVF